MDEVISLETEIIAALIADRIPAGVLPWAQDILCNGWTDPGSRLDRLRTIATSIRADRPQPIADEAPEALHECDSCAGEGSIEVWESVSKWAIDPPCAQAFPCKDCNGAGFYIDDAKADA